MGQLEEPLLRHLVEQAERFGPAAGERKRPRELAEQDLFPVAVANSAGVGNALLEQVGGFLAAVASMQVVAEIEVSAQGRGGKLVLEREFESGLYQRLGERNTRGEVREHSEAVERLGEDLGEPQ